MQSRRRRIKFGHDHRRRKLPLRFQIHRYWSWHQFNRVVIALGCLQNLRMKNREPHENAHGDRLRAVAQEKLRPRRSPPRQRRKQVYFRHEGSHKSVLTTP